MLNIRKATYNDIDVVVAIHLQRFLGFFLSNLGDPFLKVFYTAFLKRPGVLLVLEDDGLVQGFVAGSRDHRGFYKKLVAHHLVEFMGSGLRILVSKPMALLRIVSNVRESEHCEIESAMLLSIATLPNKKGYGKSLLSAFEKEISKENIEKLPISLTTDCDDNGKVIGFYRENGYEVVAVFERYQHRRMYRFIKYMEKN